MNSPGKGAARILRYEVQVDDEWHDIALTGDILHVAARTPHAVEIWAWSRPWCDAQERTFRVFGTGHEIATPENRGWLTHVGTAVCAGGRIVWHLVERTGSL